MTRRKAIMLFVVLTMAIVSDALSVWRNYYLHPPLISPPGTSVEEIQAVTDYFRPTHGVPPDRFYLPQALDDLMRAPWSPHLHDAVYFVPGDPGAKPVIDCGSRRWTLAKRNDGSWFVERQDDGWNP
jgi:hypothetical protein